MKKKNIVITMLTIGAIALMLAVGCIANAMDANEKKRYSPA